MIALNLLTKNVIVLNIIWNTVIALNIYGKKVIISNIFMQFLRDTEIFSLLLVSQTHCNILSGALLLTEEVSEGSSLVSAEVPWGRQRLPPEA